MRSSDAFPGTYLKAADLQGRDALVTMGLVEMKDVGQKGSPEIKPVLHFHGKDKGMVLNKTNFNSIESWYGDSDDWNGKQIILFDTLVEFKGDMVPALRVRKPAQAAAPEPAPEPAPAAPDGDDDIPF